MKTREIIVNKTIAPTFSFDAYIEADRENCLFFDIETLGFHRRLHPVALIGVIRVIGNQLQLTQWMSDSANEEEVLLERFFECITEDTILISFNGKRFDWPFLSARAKKHRILPPRVKKHIDLFQFYRGGFASLDVETHTLRELTKTNFQFFSAESREIPELLRQHLSASKDDQNAKMLFTHNEEDLLSLLALEEKMNAIHQHWQIRTALGTLTLLSVRATDDYYIIRYLPSNQTVAHGLISQEKNYAIDWIQSENQVEFKMRFLSIEQQGKLLHLLPEQWMPFPLPHLPVSELDSEELNQLRILKYDETLNQLLIHEICRAATDFLQ